MGAYRRQTPIRLAVILLAVAPAAAQEPAATAFVHVTVIPMDRERLLPEHTVIVQGNRIAALGPTARVKVPAGARRIDGRGKFLMPGLADMHSHVGQQPGLFLYIANGVTTIREMGGGMERLRKLRAASELMPPRIYGSFNGGCTNGTALTKCLLEKKAVGYDYFKTGGDIPPERIDSIAVATRAAGFHVGGHVSRGGPSVLERALAIPYRSIEHLTGYLDYLINDSLPWFPWDRVDSAALDTAAWMQPGYRFDSARLRTIAVATQRAGTWNAPTLVVQMVPIKPNASPAMRGLVRRAQLDLQVVKALHEAGAGLLLSTDMGELSGYAVHRELELLVQAGLTPYHALETATRNVAVYLGTQDSAGTVALGKWADLVLLDGNPLQNIHNTSAPAGVMVDGRWFSRADIDARLDTLETRGHRLAELRREASQHRGIRASLE